MATASSKEFVTPRGVAVRMADDRETPNKRRFQEKVADGGAEAIGQVYVPKVTLDELGYVQGTHELEVTVKVVYPL